MSVDEAIVIAHYLRGNDVNAVVFKRLLKMRDDVADHRERLQSPVMGKEPSSAAMGKMKVHFNKRFMHQD